MLQAGGQIVTAAGVGTSALAVGILVSTADATGGTQMQTLEASDAASSRSANQTPEGNREGFGDHEMTQAHVEPQDLMLIVLSPDRYPTAHRIKRAALTPSFELGEERFTEITNDDFFGFYDWLRPEPDRIIGLHIVQDETVDIDLGQVPLLGLEIISRPEWNGARNLKILFGNRSDFDERLSLDQDFGDNGIFHGSNGSVVLVFNAPPDEDVFVQG